MSHPRSAALAPVIDRWVPVAVFAALPTLGLAAGPSYAALVFGLAVVQLVGDLALGRRIPAIDRPLVALAGGFLILCWASVTWSVAPSDSLRGAGQETTILLLVLIVCTRRPAAGGLAGAVFPVMLAACLVGVVAAGVDMKLGYHLEAVVSGKPGLASATKYNRGLDYLALIVWPVLGFAVWRRWWRRACLLMCAVIAAEAIGLSLAGRMAVAVGLGVLLLAWVFPRVLPACLTLATGVFAAGLPLLLHAAAAYRAALAPYLKPSGVHRLEISDYMTARVFERPLLGWGLSSAKSVPIHPAELTQYIYVDPRGVYPHNQWLELWVELGAVGAVFGLALAGLVLWRIRRLPVSIRPFAYATFAAAMAVSCVNYEITTDSWWAALGASAALFVLLGRHVASGSPDGRAA
jgi:hypothetical protein